MCALDSATTPDTAFEHEALELSAILETMADGVFVIDNDHRILRWNAAMERLTGYALHEVAGKPCSLLRGSTSPEGPSMPLDCNPFAKGNIDKHETLIQRKDGDLAPALASARVLKDRMGEVSGAVVTLTDISSVRKLENEVDRLRREVQKRHRYDNLIGVSKAMQEVFNLIEMAADSFATVLIAGETGTGKEVVAKAIHYHSDRKNGPLVRVNCSALSESLLESELFGHVRGAFTGAVRDNAGRFETAAGGTIMLDEIGEMPASVQVKLLRVLQEREVERVGESTPRKVDVRVIAATHRDLQRLVESGAFREDLYYRLKVFPIRVPPLRERKEDIEPLLAHFIEELRVRTGKKITGVDGDAMRILMDYCWPGNVRELENAVEHAFVTCPGGLAGPLDLPIEIRRIELKRRICGPESEGSAASAETSSAPKRGASRDEILALLTECAWNKAEVARRLGITRTSVWRRMKALSIPLDREEAAQEHVPRSQR
ncbi:MAG: sigma 54-interacting transcriptional regulator [Candidatus Hydrogenedentes bacterium]|nr:sigma 54-interacting transcriptional regulator [Candidatus Hydrogenedentota bacterium]